MLPGLRPFPIAGQQFNAFKFLKMSQVPEYGLGIGTSLETIVRATTVPSLIE
jgi:hypothetical protein